MSPNTVLAEFFRTLPDIKQLQDLIVFLKNSSYNESYNSNYARELISNNIKSFFKRTTLLQNYSISEFDQSDLLFEFGQWVHITVDEYIKKNPGTNNVVTSKVINTSTLVINNGNDFSTLPDIQQLQDLIVFLKNSSDNESYNSNYARELISNNIKSFFKRTTLLQNYSISEFDQSDLLFEFGQWVHITVDEEIKKNPGTNNVITSKVINSGNVFNKSNNGDSYNIANNNAITDSNNRQQLINIVETAINNRQQVPGFVEATINTVQDDSTDVTSNSEAITANTSFSRRKKFKYEIEQYNIECNKDEVQIPIEMFQNKYRCVNKPQADSFLYFVDNANQGGRISNNERFKILGCTCQKYFNKHDNPIRMMVAVSLSPNGNKMYNAVFRVNKINEIELALNHFVLNPSQSTPTINNSTTTTETLATVTDVQNLIITPLQPTPTINDITITATLATVTDVDDSFIKPLQSTPTTNKISTTDTLTTVVNVQDTVATVTHVQDSTITSLQSTQTTNENSTSNNLPTVSHVQNSFIAPLQSTPFSNQIIATETLPTVTHVQDSIINIDINIENDKNITNSNRSNNNSDLNDSENTTNNHDISNNCTTFNNNDESNLSTTQENNRNMSDQVNNTATLQLYNEQNLNVIRSNEFRNNEICYIDSDDYEEFFVNEHEDESVYEEYDPNYTTDDDSDVIELDSKPAAARFKRESDDIQLSDVIIGAKQRRVSLINENGENKQILYQNQYMLTDVEHKSTQGWYECPVLIPDFKSGDERFKYEDELFPIPPSKNFDEPVPYIVERLPIECMACQGLNHDENDFFAVYTACKTNKHPFCHTCFNIDIVKSFTYSERKGPERLTPFQGCTVCNVHNGEWRNAKYSPSTKRWLLGKILPDGVNILAYHQRMYRPVNIEKNAIQYNNYITCYYLLNALKKDNGIPDETIQINYPITPLEYHLILDTYQAANDVFLCQTCNKKKKVINQCTLRKCASYCGGYDFCRDCFLDRIIKGDKTSYGYKNGLLECPHCKVTSRAIFFLTGRYVAWEDRNKLLKQTRDKNYWEEFQK